MKKHYFFRHVAKGNIPILHLVALALAAICLLISLVSTYQALSTSFFDLPILTFFDQDGEIDNIKEEHEELLEDFDDFEKSEIREFEEKTGVDFDKFLKYFSKPSLYNLTKIGSYVNQYGDEVIDRESLNIIKIVVLVIAAYGTVLALFTLLFAYRASGGLAIFTFILSIPFQLIFCKSSLLMTLALFTIAYAVVQGKLNREYRRYKKAIRNNG